MCDVLLSKYQGTICSCYFFFFLIFYKEHVLLVEKLSFGNKTRHKQLNKLTDQLLGGGGLLLMLLHDHQL